MDYVAPCSRRSVDYVAPCSRRSVDYVAPFGRRCEDYVALCCATSHSRDGHFCRGDLTSCPGSTVCVCVGGGGGTGFLGLIPWIGL